MKKKRTRKVVPAAAEAVGEPVVEQAAGVRRVRSLAELEEEIKREVAVLVRIGVEVMDLPVRRLSPAECEKLERILNEQLPPMKRNPETGKEEFDLGDPAHNQAQRRREREARALACWWACPLFGSAPDAPVPEPGLELTRERICAYVEGKLTEQILDQIYEVARSLDMEVMARLNF